MLFGSVEVAGTMLTMDFRHAGGCEEHVFATRKNFPPLKIPPPHLEVTAPRQIVIPRVVEGGQGKERGEGRR